MNKLISTSMMACLSFGIMTLASQAHADSRAALADYTRTAHAIVQQLQILSNSASSCGFIGSVMSSRMSESLQKEQEQISAVTAAAQQGAAGKGVIQQRMQAMERGNQELRSSSGMIRRGLANGDATCRQAETAFTRMSSLSFALPPKMAKIIESL